MATSVIYCTEQDKETLKRIVEYDNQTLPTHDKRNLIGGLRAILNNALSKRGLGLVGSVTENVESHNSIPVAGGQG